MLALGRSDAGVAQYAGNILKEFATQENLSFDVYISSFSQYKWQQLDGSIAYFCVSTYRNKFEFIWRLLFTYPFLCLKILFNLAWQKYDLLYIPYFHHWDLGFILLFRLFGKKVVYTVHDGIQHYGEEDRLGQWLMFRSIAYATDVIFLSNFVRAEINNHLKYHGVPHVIPHGLIRFNGIRTAKQYSKQPVLLFIGRISKYKGVELLVDSLRLLDGDVYSKCIIAGQSNYSLSLDLPASVELIDKYLTEVEIVNYLNQADIIIMPYLEASQSGVATLAIAAGIPVVATEVGGLPEQLQNGAVWVKPDPESLAQGIKSLITDEMLFYRLQANLVYIHETLRWDRIASQISTIFISNNL